MPSWVIKPRESCIQNQSSASHSYKKTTNNFGQDATVETTRSGPTTSLRARQTPSPRDRVGSRGGQPQLTDAERYGSDRRFLCWSGAQGAGRLGNNYASSCRRVLHARTSFLNMSHLLDAIGLGSHTDTRHPRAHTCTRIFPQNRSRVLVKYCSSHVLGSQPSS